MIPIPDPGDRGVPRYSTRPFPAYRFVPGLHPHPNRDPAGHSYQPTRVSSRHAPWDVQDWQRLDEWRYGVDLFNRFYFWEAHEVWEGLWTSAARDTPAALLLQGLIQMAAALLKTHMGVVAGARTLSTQGLEKMRRAGASTPQLLGLNLAAVAARLEDYFAPVRHSQLPVIGETVPALRLEGLEN